MCDFSEKTLFLRGLSDTELQQDLLAEEDLSLDKCLRIATARETAKRSQETFNTPNQAEAFWKQSDQALNRRYSLGVKLPEL